MGQVPVAAAVTSQLPYISQTKGKKGAAVACYNTTAEHLVPRRLGSHPEFTMQCYDICRSIWALATKCYACRQQWKVLHYLG